MSLPGKFGKAWRRLSTLSSSGDRLARIESQMSATLNRLEPLLARAQLDRELEKSARVDPKRLELHGFRALSQYDADGILAEIFRRIGEEHRSFVEFGTGNGLENNTAYLLGQGWRGVWLEGDEQMHQAQLRNHPAAIEAGRLRCVRSFLTRENINEVIRGAGASGPIDLLSVDIDGNDYHLWEALTVVEPRVVVAEYNGYVPRPLRWVMAYNPTYEWGQRSTYFGAALASFEALARRKGLRLVGCDIVGLNAFSCGRISAAIASLPATRVPSGARGAGGSLAPSPARPFPSGVLTRSGSSAAPQDSPRTSERTRRGRPGRPAPAQWPKCHALI